MAVELPGGWSISQAVPPLNVVNLASLDREEQNEEFY